MRMRPAVNRTTWLVCVLLAGVVLGVRLKPYLVAKYRGKMADLSGAVLIYAPLAGADLDYANLERARLDAAHLNAADLSGADLRDACLRRAILYGADLSRADLDGADLRDADLRDANLGGSNLAWVVVDQVSGWDNVTRCRVKRNGARLQGANLRGTHLECADLSGIDLTGANLSCAGLTGTDLTSAKLTGATLTGARYDEYTRWPAHLDPQRQGAILVKEIPMMKPKTERCGAGKETCGDLCGVRTAGGSGSRGGPRGRARKLSPISPYLGRITPSADELASARWRGRRSIEV
jgi:uncharacterized protein YjbI with pentapeptide repeats